jgi:hypothetical protein
VFRKILLGIIFVHVVCVCFIQKLINKCRFLFTKLYLFSETDDNVVDLLDAGQYEYFYAAPAVPTFEQQFDDLTDSSSTMLTLTNPTGNISLSLRNSLLQLRHTRRHLAALIETTTTSDEKTAKIKIGGCSNGGSSTSSTTSSLTTTSSMSLYKQHLLNLQNQSNGGGQSSSRKPCVYMLQDGRCARADCRFVHDLKTITCKYWLEGECLKGDACEFLHEHVEEEAVSSRHDPSKNLLAFSFGSVNSSNSGVNTSGGKKKKSPDTSERKVKLTKKDFKLDTEEFPALGGGGGCFSSPAPTNTNSSSSTDTITNCSSRKPATVELVRETQAQSTPAPTATPVKQTQPKVETPVIVLKAAPAAAPTPQPAISYQAKTAASVLLANVVGGKAKAGNSTTTPVKSLASVLLQQSSKARPFAANENKPPTSSSTSSSTTTTKAKTATPVISIRIKENSATSSSNGRTSGGNSNTNKSRASSKTRGGGGKQKK